VEGEVSMACLFLIRGNFVRSILVLKKLRLTFLILGVACNLNLIDLLRACMVVAVRLRSPFPSAQE